MKEKDDEISNLVQMMAALTLEFEVKIYIGLTKILWPLGHELALLPEALLPLKLTLTSYVE